MATPARQRAQAKYNAKPEQKKRRAMRNKARRLAIREGRARKGDGKDVGHANGNPMDNRRSNRVIESKASNRSFPRTKGAHKKNKSD